MHTDEIGSPAVVVGARGGIGAACVEKLRCKGVHTVALDLPEADVTNREEMRDVINSIGRISVLIYCSGVMVGDSSLDPSEVEVNFAVNFGGLVNVCSEVAKNMCTHKAGSIVVVSSNAATTARIGMASYGASKAAASAWIRTLALECAPFGVRCNVVSPGSTDTSMLRGMWPAGEDKTEDVIAGQPDNFRLGIPLKKLATAEDVANACVFLSSSAASHITMHDLRVDGGATFDK